ncbi:MAG TPA: sigma-70 family RNA polymerase sigma factor [Gaiellaceae bacterium]
MAAVAAERRLFGLVRDRAEQEFERMYRRHAEDVFRYSLLVLRSRPDAEDVTQATFTRAYKAIQRGEKVRKPQHWLIRIAHNECRRHLRTASRRAFEVELDPAIADLHEPDDGPTAEEIRVALSHLSFNQRAALVMRELEDRSYAEIAEVLGLSVSAVETLLFRARRALREQMEGPLACGEVEVLLFKQMDGELSVEEKRRLRAHTRSCAECSTLERQHRGRRAALRRLGSIITLPPSLSSFVGGGSSAVATGALVGLGAKAAAVVIAALTVAGVGVAEAVKSHGGNDVRQGRPVTVDAPRGRAPAPAAARVQSAAPAIASDAALRVAPAAAKAAAVGGVTAGPNPHNTPGFERPAAKAAAPPAAKVPEPAAASTAPPPSATPTRPAREAVKKTIATVTATLPALPPVQAPPTPTVTTPELPIPVPTVTVPTLPAVTVPVIPPPPPPPKLP